MVSWYEGTISSLHLEDDAKETKLRAMSVVSGEAYNDIKPMDIEVLPHGEIESNMESITQTGETR